MSLTQSSQEITTQQRAKKKMQDLGSLQMAFMSGNDTAVEESSRSTMDDWGSNEDLLSAGDHKSMIAKSLDKVRQMRANQLPQLSELERQNASYSIDDLIDEEFELETDDDLHSITDIENLQSLSKELQAKASMESNTFIRRATRCQSFLAEVRAKLKLMENDLAETKETGGDENLEKKQAHHRYLETRCNLLEEDLGYWISLGDGTITGGEVIDLTDFKEASVGLASVKQEFKDLLERVDTPWSEDTDEGAKVTQEFWKHPMWPDGSAPFSSPFFDFSTAPTLKIEVCGPKKILASGLKKDTIQKSIDGAMAKPIKAYQKELDKLKAAVIAYGKELDAKDAKAAKEQNRPPAPSLGLEQLAMLIQRPDDPMHNQYKHAQSMFDVITEEMRWEATWGAIMAVDAMHASKENWKKYRTIRIRKVAKCTITLATSTARLVVSAGSDVGAWYSAATAVAGLWNVYAEETTSMHTLYQEMDTNLAKLLGQMEAVYGGRVKWTTAINTKIESGEISGSNARKNLLAVIGDTLGISSAFIAKYATTAKTLEKRLQLFRYQIVKSERKLDSMQAAIDADVVVVSTLRTKTEKTPPDGVSDTDVDTFCDNLEELEETLNTLSTQTKACSDGKHGPIQAYHTRALEFELMIRHYNLFASSLLSSMVINPESGSGTVELGDFVTIASTTSQVYNVVKAAPEIGAAWSELAATMATLFSGAATLAEVL